MSNQLVTLGRVLIWKEGLITSSSVWMWNAVERGLESKD